MEISRRHIFAIFVGFFIILGLGIITSALSFFMTFHLIRDVSPQDFPAAFYQQPYLTFSWLLRIISFISPILAGVVVGWIAREKGWLYGGFLGILLKLISVGTVFLTFLLPTSLIFGANMSQVAGDALVQKNILNQLLYAPITIILIALGGWLGESFYKRRHKQLKDDKIILKQVLIITLTLIFSILISLLLPKAEYKFPDEFKLNTPTGQNVTFGQDIKIPKEVPGDLPIYQNGRVTSVISDDKNSVVSIETKDNPKSVLDWHKSELLKNNWEITSENYFSPSWEDTGNLWFENQKYTGQVTVSNRNHANPEKPTETVRINISVKLK